MAVAFVAVGANLAGPRGSPAETVAAAVEAIGREHIVLKATARLYRSQAWPNPTDPEFINTICQLEVDINPESLLKWLHEIETRFGRVRREPNAPRTLDLDLVDYGGQVSAPGATPILPHPRMADRAFVLLPLAEIAPHWRHPVDGRTITELIAALPDPSTATPIGR